MRKFPTLKEIFGPQGTGNYGKSGQRQLVAPLNPATKYIEDLEQSEINQNIEDQSRLLGNQSDDKKESPVGPNEPAKFSNIGNISLGNNPLDPNFAQQVSYNPYGGRKMHPLNERDLSDQFYKDLPGYPKHNTIENPTQHVPTDENAERAEYEKHQEEEFNSRDLLVAPRDFLDLPTNTNTPQFVGSVGAIVKPKKHMNETLKNYLKLFIESVVKEELEKTTPFFNGMDGKSKTPKGGSEAFEKSRKEVFDDLYDEEGKIKYE